MALNIEQLMALADRLDKEGQHDEADKIDAMVKKMAVTMVKDVDPEFEKAYKEEHGNAPGEVYVGKPEVKPGDEPMLSPKAPILDDEFKSKLTQLMEEGWNIFGPGDLEKWMEQGEYTKAPPELPGLQLTEKDLQEEGDPEGLPGLLVPEEKEAAAEDGEINLPPHQPGLMNLESPHRFESSNTKQELDKLWTSLPIEVQEDIGSKLYEYLSPTQPQPKDDPLSDEEVSSALEKAEQEKGVKWSATKKIFEKLSEVADKLDKIGAVDEAGLIDGFIKKHADEVLDYKGEDENGEQSKRYDSKHHHSLQVREPKTKQERVDREGREKHHNHTMQHIEAGALNSRYCPEHIGVTLGRVGDLTYQCPLDGQVYNWETGWTDYDGKEHPGGSVAAQTPDSSGYSIPHRIFDSRENISNRVN